ncbi:MAG: Cof-type HAD-IIB family hydrolase [Peptoniphilaceae bacterium]|uniref:Cof-type HAD-IIB family hydrolase n=1 Tax=Parvimonas sp. TaxID=1944660 RepID=UPI002A75AF94|nr:Cof-type HAD-IIB family hydrolase [Parvimonas sp.]MDD7764501.1 Cof-type HAD-IIB family hydrolase [Peptoniphilaceae bacterium]MDY3050480.1 Cof-type HAD-IIB family hydrolase [Parvimonas sp.]
MYKLIALDIDGTTFNDEHKISNEVRESLFYAVNKGVKVVFISGREEFTIKKILKELNLDTYYSALNGSIISTTYSEKAVVVNALNNEYVFEILEKIENSNLIPIIFLQDEIFTKNIDDKYLDIVSNFINPKILRVDDLKEYIIKNNLKNDILKIGICNEYDVLKNLETNLIQNFKDEYTVSFSLPFFLEIMAKNVDKGYALKSICEINDISLSKTIAMGDGENDIPMLKICGLSVGMGNAMDNVRKVSKYITDTNQNDGVAKAIRKFI